MVIKFHLDTDSKKVKTSLPLSSSLDHRPSPNFPQRGASLSSSLLIKPLLLTAIFFFSFCNLSFSNPSSPLTNQKKAVEKNLKSKLSFDKKAKAIAAFKKWTDKEVLTNSDKLSEDELTEIMQYSNLLKALNPTKLNIKNCNKGANLVLEEDFNPLNNKPSPPALTILSWLKSLCPKGK